MILYQNDLDVLNQRYEESQRRLKHKRRIDHNQNVFYSGYPNLSRLLSNRKSSNEILFDKKEEINRIIDDFSLNMPYGCFYSKEKKEAFFFNRYLTYIGETQTTRPLNFKIHGHRKTFFFYGKQLLPIFNESLMFQYIEKLKISLNYHIITQTKYSNNIIEIPNSFVKMAKLLSCIWF